MFNHVDVGLPWKDLPTKIINGKRHYIFPSLDGIEVPLPSVTTVLSETSDKEELHAWRKRVGEKEANRVSRLATSKGTAVHDLLEKHLLNEQIDTSRVMPHILEGYLAISEVLNKHVNNIAALEWAAASLIVGVAGRIDCVAEYDGVPSIVDFKTSKRVKTAEDIQNYFIQSTAYALLFEECTGIPIRQIVILMCVDGYPTAKIFKEDPRRFYRALHEVLEKYRKTRIFPK